MARTVAVNFAAALLKFMRWMPISMLLLSVCASAQSGDLEKVLDQMDAAAAKFRTTQTNFTWAQYNKVINDITETQKGKIFFRRVGKEIQMAAHITQPEAKLLIFSEGNIQVYQPRIDQIDVYDASAHREEFESFLVLGFGGGGHDMLKSFDVEYLGTEKIDGIDTAKLDLVPKSEKIKHNFAHITLWIDAARGVSLQQQLFETSGDYRLAKYSDIQINQKIADSVFKLKTSSKTKILNH
jgi:outer membrane lipoprotein-sorting protein